MIASVAISAHRLTKTFGEGDLAVAAVREVDLDVAKGEVVLVMGPSGSGKTTLLLMLGAMLRPTMGSIEVDGVDLAAAPERRLPALRARHFGFMFQDFNLLSALDALENVELACNLAGVTGRRARERAEGLLRRLGLGHRLRFRPEQLSGGEKQRVAIARALANDPSVILANEPTANLDTSHGREIARLLRRLAVEDGRSVVIVSHDVRLKEIAHRAVAGGRLLPGAGRHGHRPCLPDGGRPGRVHAVLLAGRAQLVVLLRRLPQGVRGGPRALPRGDRPVKPLAPAGGDHLVRRLRRIEGQVRGLQRMLARQQPGLDVITQLVATRAALDAVGILLLEGHLWRCGSTTDDGQLHESTEQLVAIVERFVQR